MSGLPHRTASSCRVAECPKSLTFCPAGSLWWCSTPLDAVLGNEKWTRLHVVMQEGQAEVARVLLKAGANADESGFEGHTLLTLAVVVSVA